MNFINRDSAILENCKNKNVLHLGCIGFTDLSSKERIELLNQTLHFKLYKISNSLIGLDYSKEVIESIKDIEGFNNVYFANVEKLNEVEIDNKFDVIVVGDLIEHLSNPGNMLEGIKLFCSENTNVIITTPNSFGIASFLRFLFNKFKEGEEHVMTFNEFNLTNLIQRHGLKVVSIDSCYHEHSKKIFSFKLLKYLLNLFPKFGGTLFMIVQPK